MKGNGLLATIAKSYFSRRVLPYWCVLAIDCVIVLLSTTLGFYIEFGVNRMAGDTMAMALGAGVILVFFIIFFRIFHTYSGIIRYSSFIDLQHIGIAAFCASAASLLCSLTLDWSGVKTVIMPKCLGLLETMLTTVLLMWIVRVLVKGMFETYRIAEKTKKTFIYGVKSGGVSLAKSLQNDVPAKYSLEGFVNPDADENIDFLMGHKVLNDDAALVENLKAAHTEVLIVSPLQVDKFRHRQEMIDELINSGVKILMMPMPEEWDGHSDLHHSGLREVQIEDLLPRDKIEVNMSEIEQQLRGNSVLITGAAGSIGSEIVRQVASFGPSEMVLIDQAETPMHDIRLMMAREYSSVKAFTIVASICNEEFMERIFKNHKPQYVFHAAAYKHVPMMEDNPAIAIQNNVRGTHVIADLAVRYGTLKFVMISTDKAVNPTNVMGCSKRICEIYCQSLNAEIHKFRESGLDEVSEDSPLAKLSRKPVTQFVTTRFGNVLGSNGSVIPLFTKQIREGGPLTVTDPRIIRYFMLIPEACKLVLEAATIGHGGEIFVFDMGEPVKIVDLARRMITLSGATNVKIEFTGLRDGEKLYEELLAAQENVKPTRNKKIMIATVREYDYVDACEAEQNLFSLSREADALTIVNAMRQIVPEYNPQNDAYRA